MSKQVILTIPDSVDLSALQEMKLILRYYKDGNDLYEYSTDSFSLSESKGDLISREALKDFAYINKGNFNTVEGIREWIDNAPTVLHDNYSTGYQDGIRKALSERPQGEWEDYDNTFYKCPDCGYLLEKCCPQCQNKVILPKGGAV